MGITVICALGWGTGVFPADDINQLMLSKNRKIIIVGKKYIGDVKISRRKNIC